MASIAESAFAQSYEQARSPALLPEYLQSDASNIVRFVSLYYEYLNKEGMPSHEISSIRNNHDIDLVSDKHLTRIQTAIAATLPDSRVLDKVRLYKMISKYYNTRGSVDSIHTFFKIFFNEVATIIYPKENLFNSSGDRSASSSNFTLQDSYYWQDFSYVIKTLNDTQEWKDEFLKLAHPAGLKLFTQLIVEASNHIENQEPSQYLLGDPSFDEYWHSIDWEEAYGKILPYQPGTNGETDLYWIFIANLGYTLFPQRKEITKNSDDPYDYRYLVATLLLAIELQLTNTNPLEALFRDEYQHQGKFFDSTPLEAGLADHTIAGASTTYSSINEDRFWGLSSMNTINTNHNPSEIIACELNHQDQWSSSYLRESNDYPFETLKYHEQGYVASDTGNDIDIPEYCNVVTHGDQFLFFDTDKMTYSDDV